MSPSAGIGPAIFAQSCKQWLNRSHCYSESATPDFTFNTYGITYVLIFHWSCLRMRPVQLFKLLADETRTTIILLLREAGELCVCELCSVTNQSQPKVSRHIALLREAGLVLDRREGKWIYYRLSPHMPAWVASIIETAWSSQRDEVRESLNSVNAAICG